jgi:hypothetical protein
MEETSGEAAKQKEGRIAELEVVERRGNIEKQRILFDDL